jgi:hypothetical protein
MAFCLPPTEAEKFKKAIIGGEIDPTKLAEMSSADRHAFFAERFGEDAAAPMNTLLESKLLLKNQQAGMINWAKRMMGQNKPAQRDMISRIQNMQEVLTPKDENAFLEDLASQRLGTRVSYDEAKTIADLSSKVSETKAAMDTGGDRMDYGRAVVALKNQVEDMVRESRKMNWQDVKSNPLKGAGKLVNTIAGNAKSLKASMDDSAIFRQGWKTLWTHPEIWQKNARQSFVDLVKAFGSDQVMNEVNADIVSRPTFDLMKQAKLAVSGVQEEAFPTSLPEKIPGLGRVYRASEHAYNAFVQRTRADVFDKYLDIAEKSGVTLDKPQLESIGKLVNSLTGRGNLGPLEPIANVVNNVFFSPRFLKSNIDTLLLHPTDEMSGFARKQAAINLLKIIGGTAAVLAIAKAVKKDSVDLDPRSADFGKIKVGHTRFDVSGGMSSIVTLAAREATQSTKSSTTGNVHPLNSGKFGAQTGTDVLYNFFENKLSPAASVAKDLMKGKTSQGAKPTVANEAQNLVVPMMITNYQELKNDPKSANILAAMIADSMGIATNTYGPAVKK